jgi:hypothetical protein
LVWRSQFGFDLGTSGGAFGSNLIELFKSRYGEKNLFGKT